MGFKRKRSSDDSPLSISSFGGFSSTPEALSPTPLPDHGGAMDLDTISSSSTSRFNYDFGKRSWGLPVTRVEASDLGSRTRKRFRDNRPDERVIHEKTMHLLFSAQRNPTLAIATSSPEPQSTLLPLPAKPQKSTLHSFWNLPAPPVTIQPPTPTPNAAAAAAFDPQSQPQAQHQHNHLPHCEDCDAPLHSESSAMDMDVDMEMNGAGTGGAVGNAFACNDCGRSICGTCAVVSRTRHCLQCATTGRNSRRWW
ncbi:hypothetical protein K505DRAFT_274559 [Melanomma pulvis-pyrius CBS 109.77]|uniref:Uncharacterized protein n=1 Tax=Melanomma pulvis-pyrius CBS 109.77 TaxID=1314802 RepID=A0A6A6XEP4_9PLEO|nr:hypothetical protein K505DRAFT_274559 [Melanomma pulvis-pyrius CBS 109.77]